MTQRDNKAAEGVSQSVILFGRGLDIPSSESVGSIDRFVFDQLEFLKLQYRRIGNPRLMFLAGQSVLTAVRDMRCADQSFQVARLHAFVADMLIAHGADPVLLGAALAHLDLATGILSRLNSFSREILQTHVSATLLAGVARKALGDFDESLRFMRDMSHDFGRFFAATDIDLVPLSRQETIMLQTPQGHRQLLESALAYRETHRREYYGSIKRVFEYSLNTGRINDAKILYGEWRSAYLRIRRTATPISHISFLKNLGQFAIAARDTAKADIVLRRALIEAQSRSLLGQVRQIERLIAEAHDGSGAKLITYRIEPAA